MSKGYCLVWAIIFGHVRCIALHERLIPWAEAHGWAVLIKDSDMPSPDIEIPPPQSNPKRWVQWHGYGRVGDENDGA